LVFKSFEELAAAQAEIDAWGKAESYVDDPAGGGNDLRRGDADFKDFRATRWTPHATSRKWDRIDELAIYAGKREARRFKEIGRRAYALELVAKDQKRNGKVDYPDHLFWGKCPTAEAAPRAIPLAHHLASMVKQAVRPASKQRKCYA